MTIGSNKLIFMYDENGTPFGFTYNGTTYYYVKNLQGDVEAIANSSGTIVVRYYYDAWGNILDISGTLADTVGEANPIRYRSYYYDTETGYYYLQSRYYSPDLCRFISADGYVSTGQGILGFNMFVYCLNNPVNYVDPSGCVPLSVNDYLKQARRETLFGDPFEVLSTEAGTFTVGVTASGGGTIGGSVSLGITADNEGNMGIILSVEGGAGTPNLSAGFFGTYTNAPNIYKQSGRGVQTGGSVDLFFANIGYDFSAFRDDKARKKYYGHTFNVGGGVPVLPFEFHGGVSYSWVWGIDADAFQRALETIAPLILEPR